MKYVPLFGRVLIQEIKDTPDSVIVEYNEHQTSKQLRGRVVEVSPKINKKMKEIGIAPGDVIIFDTQDATPIELEGFPYYLMYESDILVKEVRG